MVVPVVHEWIGHLLDVVVTPPFFLPLGQTGVDALCRPVDFLSRPYAEHQGAPQRLPKGLPELNITGGIERNLDALKGP